MRNVLTGKRLTVESKFNTAGLTPNQVAAQSNISTGRLVVDRTTSLQFGNGTQIIVTGTGGQIKRN